MLCIYRKTKVHQGECQYGDHLLPVVLHVLVGADVGVVDQIEEGGPAHGALDEGSHAAVLGQAVLVVPAPVGPEQFNQF